MQHHRQHITQPFVVLVRCEERLTRLSLPRGVPTVAAQLLDCGESAALVDDGEYAIELRNDGACGYTLTLQQAARAGHALPVQSFAIRGASVREVACHKRFAVQHLDRVAKHLISRALPAIERHFGVGNPFMQRALETGAMQRGTPAALRGYQPGFPCGHVLRHNRKALAFLQRVLGPKFDAALALSALRLFAQTLHTCSGSRVYHAGVGVQTASAGDKGAALAAFDGADAQVARGTACVLAWPGYSVYCVRVAGAGAAPAAVLCRGVDPGGRVADGVVLLDAATDPALLRREVALGTLSLGAAAEDLPRPRPPSRRGPRRQETSTP